MKKFLLICILTTSCIVVFAQTNTNQYWTFPFTYPTCSSMLTNCTKWPVVNGGQWDAGSTWNGGTVPGNNDIVCIPSGWNVVVKGSTYNSSVCPAPANPTASPRLSIFVCGTITFDPSGKLYLACWSFVQIWPNGKVLAGTGSSDLIQVGGDILWGGPGSNANQGDLTGPVYVASPKIGNGILSASFDYIKVKSGNPYQLTIEWATLQEFNSNSFVIERSTNQQSWTSVGNMKAAGNSSGKINYSFVDKNPLGGVSFYRIKQIDTEGKVSYSDIAKAENGSLTKSIRVYPNPVSGIANIYSKGNFKAGQILQLIDAKGSKVKMMNLPVNNNYIQADLSSLSPGLYLVQMIENGQIIESTSLVKQ